MALDVEAGKSGASGPVLAWGEPPRKLQPLDPQSARDWLAELDDRLAEVGEAAFAAALDARPALREFIGAVFSFSPFLRETVLVQPARLVEIFRLPPREAFGRLVAEAAALGLAAESESQLMAGLRQARARVALLCALADLGQWWKREEITEALSDFADAALNATLDFLLRGLAASGKIDLVDPQEPQCDSGLIVLAMGKHGARELNYSSDIDLILFFEPAGMAVNTDDPVSLFTRLAKSIIRILQQRTSDGYVFRVDLRLRPDPGSTPLVIPVETALNYYEAYGQNWERAALIKARPAAGDREAGRKFLMELAPFVWRKHLDFAAISDIHSIKRQINAYRGHNEIAVRGHNIKLGRGGIREIEFFAQTQQLIAGGRLPQLRALRTLDALAALEAEGWIDAAARDELGAAYWYLRDVEHRIQMVADEQTHTLQQDDEGLARIAGMMGAPDIDTFSSQLVAQLRCVERHYAGLFEKSPQLANPGGNLVFTGDDDDPATLASLAAMGYSRPSEAIRTVRGWHFGRFAAVRSAQARELLTEITPGLLEAIAATGQADETLAAFHRFLAGLPAGIQLFALLKSNPGLLRLLLLILAAAPRLADIITRRPHVFDGLLDPNFSGRAPGRQTQRRRLAAVLARTAQYEAALDAARIFASEQKFLIAVRFINRAISARAVGRAFSGLADVLIEAMLERVEAEFALRHGRVAGGRLVVLGMGRLGSCELTAGSDLDLMLLYDHDASAEASDGPRPLAASQYFIRLTQRLIAAMSAPTAEGVIYELDFRLRPSGNAGPLATHVGGFLKYQREEAWTWERQALTRGRIVAGDPSLAAEIEAGIALALAEPMAADKLASDVAKMRALIDAEKGTDNPFEVKMVAGGLVDVEFIAQWATLRAGRAGAATVDTSILGMIETAGEDLIGRADRQVLLEAADLYNTVLQFVRLCMDGEFRPGEAPRGLGEMLCARLDLPDLRVLEAQLRSTQKSVRAMFRRLIG